MFNYSDPTGTDTLIKTGALKSYQRIVERAYQGQATLPGSAFTLLEAFDGLPPDKIDRVMVDWLAFPLRFAQKDSLEIDKERFKFHEEYIEWSTKKNQAQKLQEITFTTEFREYFMILAATDTAALKDEIQKLYPEANPTDVELFGANFNQETVTPSERAGQFEEHLPRNPWNNGEKGILCLTEGPNSLGALFGLLGACGIVQDVESAEVCANVEGACVPGRSSDPRVCQAAQDLAKAQKSFSASDPAGIQILRLEGTWEINGQPIDINDEQLNQGVWKVTRNKHRATLDLSKNVTIAGEPITSGAQVAAKLVVGAEVLFTADKNLPVWAQMGKERLLKRSHL